MRRPTARKRRSTCAALAVLVAVTTLVSGAGAADASAAPGFAEYVALGDSFSADVSLVTLTTEQVPLGCGQSSKDYPKQLALELHVAVFRDATCGSAKFQDMYAPQDVNRVGGIGGVNPAQFDRLTPTTDLVTLGISGNDVGLIGVATACINVLPALTFSPGQPPPPAHLGLPCEPQFVVNGVDTVSQKIAAARQGLAQLVDSIRSRSPHARIALVDYLDFVPRAGCFPYLLVLNEDVPWFRAKLLELNAMIAGVAVAKGVRFADTSAGTEGHDVCQAPEAMWGQGVLPWSVSPPGPAIPFHPNQLGADHQTQAVLQALTR